MNTTVESKIEEAIKTLVKKAEGAEQSNVAMQFAQAALNLVQAEVTLKLNT